MKRFLIASVMLCASRLASAGAPAPAWCKDAAPEKPDLTHLASTDVRVVLTTFVNALCAPTAEVEDQRAELEKARAAWSKRLGMVEADWADVVAYEKARGDTVPVVSKTFAAASPLDQYAVIRDAESGLHRPYDTLYATDMFEANLSEVGRFAFLSGTCLDERQSAKVDATGLTGNEVIWAICQRDFEQLDAAKLLEEVRADTSHDGAARMKLRLEVYGWAKRAKAHAANVAAALQRDEAIKKLFEVAAGARTAWAGSVGKHTKLLELVSAMESATQTQSRKQFEGCAETTAAALADAASTIPAKLFAGMDDDLHNPFEGFATKAGPVLGQSAPVNLASIAYVLCAPKAPLSVYLDNMLISSPAMRGPRSAALGRVRDEKIELDNKEAKLAFPEARPYGKLFPQIPVRGMSGGGVVKKVTRNGELLSVEHQAVMVTIDVCLKAHSTGRVARIRDNGSVEYERVCDQPGKSSYNAASTNSSARPKYGALLKPGVRFSTIEDEVIAVWPSKQARLPSYVLGGAVK